MTRDSLFLDRDGTVNKDTGYIGSAADFTFLPGAVNALRELQTRYRIFIITNQSGVARGYFSRADVRAVHTHLEAVLGAAGVSLDGILVCYHHPRAGCGCRKPRGGLFRQAVRLYGARLEGGIMVGDKCTDIESGRRLGLRTVMVGTTDRPAGCEPDAVRPCLAAAVNLLLGKERWR